MVSSNDQAGRPAGPLVRDTRDREGGVTICDLGILVHMSLLFAIGYYSIPSCGFKERNRCMASCRGAAICPATAGSSTICLLMCRDGRHMNPHGEGCSLHPNLFLVRSLRPTPGIRRRRQALGCTR